MAVSALCATGEGNDLRSISGDRKTYLLCYMTACVSTGRSFFNQVPFKNEPGRAIYLTAEDGIGDTIKKRLRICGANMDNIATVIQKRNCSSTVRK